MLEAIPTGIFSNRFLLQQEEQLLGEFDPSIWRDKARLEVEDGTYELYREGQFPRRLRLSSGTARSSHAQRSRARSAASSPSSCLIGT